MKKNPLVSVIIPTYNEDKLILGCVDSMLSQSYQSLEIIVVDDGSTDQSLFLLEELKRVQPEVKILKQKHQGPARARNLAAKAAKGEILVLMDADMTFDQDFIKDLVSPIIAGQLKGTFSKEEYVKNWDNVWARCWQFNQNLDQRMIPVGYPDQGQDFRAIIKSEFLRVGGFDDVGYTDTWTLAKKLGYRPQAVKGAKYFHANPDNLGEVFTQAKWKAKREYKLGWFGKLAGLIRASLPVSLVIGLGKAIKYKELSFLIFKIVFDWGSFLGILELNQGKLAK